MFPQSKLNNLICDKLKEIAKIQNSFDLGNLNYWTNKRIMILISIQNSVLKKYIQWKIIA